MSSDEEPEERTLQSSKVEAKEQLKALASLGTKKKKQKKKKSNQGATLLLGDAAAELEKLVTSELPQQTLKKAEKALKPRLAKRLRGEPVRVALETEPAVYKKRVLNNLEVVFQQPGKTIAQKKVPQELRAFETQLRLGDQSKRMPLAKILRRKV
eukprot:TRINITY_DN9895_c0_g1_i1.p1 TRINITY_DN9895_c0_g1~~TRINITY_DN9895_c0_g1_i1.p1  ORF type:complete len:155 (+),score=44.86 TRINITY_DN9895_c0_g1_i1:102-566(+)